MPFLDDAANPAVLRQEGGFAAPTPQPKPAFNAMLGAAFRQENEIGSAVDFLSREHEFKPDPDYSPFTDPAMVKSRYVAEYGDRFVGVRSAMEAEALRQRIDREEEDRRLLDASGFLGTVAGIAAGIVSPTTLLPGGQAYRVGRIGSRIGRSAASVGGAAGAGVAVQELALQSTQVTRTPAESAMNIAGGVVLGGLLGGAVGALPAATRARMAADFDGTNPNPETRVLPIGGRSSVGAMAVEEADTQLVNRLGSGALARFSSFMTPLLRMQTSDAAASRAAVAKLADPGGLRLAANTEEGGFRAAVEGGPVETRVKVHTDSLLARFHEELDAVYADYWRSVTGQEGIGARAAMLTNSARKATGGVDGPMTPTEFFEHVGRAIRLDDAASADEFGRRAADVFKRHVGEVVKFLPEDMRPDVSRGPRFAGGYVPRIFNAQAIAARAREFEETVFINMKSDQARKAALQGQAQQTTSEMRMLSRRERQLQRRAETTKRQQTDINARLQEAGAFERRANRRADLNFDREKELAAEIKDLQEQLAAVKTDRNYKESDVENIEKELAVLRKEQDRALKAPKQQRRSAPVEYDTVPRDIAPGLNGPRLVRYVMGEGGKPKEFSFIDWIIKEGGIKDDGGDVAVIFGGKPPKGLINPNGRNVDDLSQSLAEWYGGRDRSEFEDKFLDYLADAAGGTNPPGWRDTLSAEMAQRLYEYDLAQDIAAEMRRANMDPSNKSDVVNFLAGGTPDELGGVIGKSVGPDEIGDIPIDPVALYRDAVDFAVAARGDLKRAERVVNAVREKVRQSQKTGARATGAANEAAGSAIFSRNRMDILLDRAERIASIDRDVSDELARLAKSKEDVRARLEKIVTEWEGDTTRAARGALERRATQEVERAQAIESGESKSKGARLMGADSEVDAAIRSIVKSERGLSDAELRSQARDVVNNMMATPEGRLPYEWGDTATRETRAAASNRAMGGPGGEIDAPFLKERRFPVRDADMLDVLDNDIRSVFHAYSHSMISQAEMARMFDGDTYGSAAIRAIKEEYGEKIAAAGSEKERLSLQKSMNDDLRDFAAMRDRILGVYGLPADPDSLFYRGATVARNFQFMSKMGMMVVSSVADAGMTIARHGFGRTLDALSAAMSHISKESSGQRLSQLERNILKDSGLAVEMTLGHRQMSFAEIASDYSRVSKFERGVRTATAGFSYLNGSRLWDTSMQTIAGIATMRRMMRNIEAWATKGNLSRGEAEWMASFNIGQPQAQRIWRAAEAGDGERVNGVLIPEGRTWGDPDAYEMFRVALKQSVDSTILKPGQDRPLWMSTATGKLIGQFRSFMIAAHQRILLSGMQQADANMVSGATAMITLGMLSVALSDLARDGKLKDREAGEWFVEGFDRSGIGGWLMEANNIAEKVSGQQFGLRPLGGQQPAARMANMSKADALLGPSLGFVADATRVGGVPFKIAADAIKGEFTPIGDQVSSGDIRAVRNQFPGQNLFWLRHGFNALQRGAEDALGIERPAPKKN